jgi:hypothetical protein
MNSNPIDIFKEYSQIYKNYLEGKIPYPFLVNYSLLRLSVMISTEDSLSKDLDNIGYHPNMKIVSDNNSFDLVLLKEVFFHFGEGKIPPLLSKEVESIEKKISLNQEKINQFL